MTPPVALTIAGTDSGGGAGVAADVTTFAGFGVHGTCAVTAVTAQNTQGVRDIQVLPSDAVRSQVTCVLDDFPVAAAKTGMLACASTVLEVARLAGEGRLPCLVVDPVLVSSTGRELIDARGVGAYRRHLLPVAAVITPNLDEAAALLGRPISGTDDMRAAARELSSYGPAVVLTGGHLRGSSRCVDVVCVNGRVHELDGPRVPSRNTHGTGCTFSAALTAGLARGEDILTAARRAKDFVAAAIAGAADWHLGRGAGPLDRLFPDRPVPGPTTRTSVPFPPLLEEIP